MSDELPTLTTKDACKQHQKRFLSIRPCKTCGSHQRYLPSFNISCVMCLGCESPKGVSVGKINASVGNHNRKVEALQRKNWSIGVAFGGFNTNTR